MDTQFIKVSPEDENVPHRRLTASPAGPGICSCSTPSCSFWRSCCPPPSGKAWRSCGRWDGTTRNCLWIIRRGKKGEKDERERCVIMKTTSDLSKRIKKTKHRAACVVMATQQQTVGEEDEGKRERREDWLLGGNAGGSIWGCGAAGEARGGVGEGWDGGHATQGGGQDVGHHHGANATLLPLSERAGLGHTNGIKHHRGSLGRGGAQWQAELGFATDRLKEDLWSCANIMYAALNEKRLIGRQEGQQLKLAPSYIELSFAAGNAPRLWRHNASPLSPGGLRSKSPDGCVRASAAPSSSPRGCESHLPGEESGGADERSSVTERAVLWGRCQWRWRRRDSPAGRWVVWGPRCARGLLGALGCRCP